MNLESILKSLENKINLNENGGCVLSGFDTNGQLLFCKGVIFTDKNRKTILSSLYNKYVNENTQDLLVDFINNVKELKSLDEIKKVDLKSQGLFIGDIKNSNGAFILPKTKGLEKISDAIKAIKQKVKFSSNNVNIYSFTSKRFIFSK